MMHGGSAILLTRHEEFAHPAPVWVHTIAPLNEMEKTRLYPRERAFRILHECIVGTVDEIVEDYRQKLTRVWQTIYQCDSNGESIGVIPAFGEASCRKQNEILDEMGVLLAPFAERHGIMKASRQMIQEREDRRSEIHGIKPRQDACTRLLLKEIVAQFFGSRFPPEEVPAEKLAEVKEKEGIDYTLCTMPPTDDPASVQKLIDALTILKEDRLARDNKAATPDALIRAYGVTRDRLWEAVREFEKDGATARHMVLTEQQYKDIQGWNEDTGTTIMGMTWEIGPEFKITSEQRGPTCSKNS